MDWTKIKETCPKSWEEVVNSPDFIDNDWVHHRALYDFFDRNYIFISIIWESIGSDEWVMAYVIKYLPKEHEDEKRRCIHFKEIESFLIGLSSYDGGWNERSEAEGAAFEKAFEILEEKLKQQL